jgi:hypothetical protein
MTAGVTLRLEYRLDQRILEPVKRQSQTGVGKGLPDRHCNIEVVNEAFPRR